MLLWDAERDIRRLSKYSRLKLAENRDTVRGAITRGKTSGLSAYVDSGVAFRI